MATATHTNLVARSTLDQRWVRHYGDSAQLFSLIPPKSAALLDMGSGAGFPGLVFSVLAESRLPQLKLTLCDSVQKKASFLISALKASELTNTTVEARRVEALPPQKTYDVITARAVTALSGLVDLAVPRLRPGGVMIFPKGRRAQEELDQAQEKWNLEVHDHPSTTDPDATIFVLRAPEKKV
ncbi:MAG: 16S rRNA (guanine(527)-N(7))-methyltransferase RsmG [Pseudomonadota bacterium]